MKKTAFVKSAAILLVVAITLSCKLFFGSGSSEYTGYFDVNNISFHTDLADSSSGYFNLGNENTITLSGVKGKTILYVNFNNSGNEFSTGGTSLSCRKLTKVSGLDTSKNNLAILAGSSSDGVTMSRSALEKSIPEPAIKNFVIPETFVVLPGTSVSDRAAEGQAKTISDFIVNKSIKQIYVDTNREISTFVKKDATLRGMASGANGSGVLVWVINDNYSDSTSSGNKVTGTIAQRVAEKFIDQYASERQVLGSESDRLIGADSRLESNSMEYTSDTGKLVNIVIYDIAGDYNSGNRCGIVGYFYSKDYYQKSSLYTNVAKYSNAGKYFYLDSAFCNYDPQIGLDESDDSKVFPGTGNVSETAISTLFHEFQHMINFNQKNIKSGASPATWYNEMLSMLSEDMMKNALGFTSSSVYKDRLPLFNNYYYMSGIDEYITSNSVVSYSTAYAFGSWCARNFGGLEFITQVSTNSYVNMESIIQAIKSCTGKTYTDRQLFKMFIQACVFREPFASNNGFSTFNTNQTPSLTTNEGKVYTLNNFNLFDTDFAFTVNNKKYTGPVIFSNEIGPRTMRPHGFAIHYAGKATSDTITLTFSTKINPSEDVMIYIQDSFKNYQ